MKLGNSIVAALVLLFVTHSAHALDPSKPFSSYLRTHFTGDNGLPDHIVKHIVQSQDGFLWMTFGSGDLVRYDAGKSIEKLQPWGPKGESVMFGLAVREDCFEQPLVVWNTPKKLFS